ncbi:formate dehydrogenase accessory sulfurtransferase FdhD [Marinomonas sp. C2222]|uniref:Sulfur carrier protein FdhD n=1 Tax=Marinomonas sargassi TaxID=2984494 RepID=A0ABT2YTY0_9GAMM|nr:formate dehydrogenase accessory sulfurtransferase FdhD [Marinomonas sargassi]MCV2403330.1 formate dehydrogenase accessory sulfurtransferase FdhD [Marinomonas sargassi]
MSASLPSFKGYQDTNFAGINPSSAPLVEETPLAISINGIAYAVIMVTPINLEVFVIGYCLSEGLINSTSDIRDIHIETRKVQLDIDSIQINLEVSSRLFAQFKKQRAHLGASGCGLCGLESLTQALPVLNKLEPSRPLSIDTLNDLRKALVEHQTLGSKTGAIHAALLLAPDNTPLCCMEDIGRHNALDKVIGYAAQKKISLHNHNILMSSRCSTELVQKAVRAGLSYLTHLASPSTLAIKLAQHYRLALIHLPKADNARIFSPVSINKDINNDG